MGSVLHDRPASLALKHFLEVVLADERTSLQVKIALFPEHLEQAIVEIDDFMSCCRCLIRCNFIFLRFAAIKLLVPQLFSKIIFRLDLDRRWNGRFELGLLQLELRRHRISHHLHDSLHPGVDEACKIVCSARYEFYLKRRRFLVQQMRFGVERFEINYV